MAEATQEKQVEQSEQLKELKTSLDDKLTAITQQLQISNSQPGPTKDEFMRANTDTIKAILEGHKKNADAVDDGADEAAADEDEKTGFWGRLLGHFKWAKTFQERAAKLAKLAKSGVVEFGKAKLKSVEKFAGNMLDLLLKGLGLGALWMLFKWLEDKDWEGIVSQVKGWVESIGLEWDNTVEVLSSIWTTLTVLSALNLMRSLVGSIKGWFGAGGWVDDLFKHMTNQDFKKWKSGEGPLRNLVRWIRNVFAGEGHIARAVRYLNKLNPITWFGEGSKLRALFTWIGGLFGGKTGAIAKAITILTESKAIQGIKNFLGKIGTRFLRILGPISWLIAGYEAVVGFMDAFEAQEGSLWDKTVAGLGGAITALMDFFLFDMVGIAEKGLKWLIKKFLGIFGMDEKAIEGSEWYQFSITDWVRDQCLDFVKLVEGIITLNPEKMGEALSGMWGRFSSFVDWIFDMLVRTPINWLAKQLNFSEEAISEDFAPMEWLNKNVIDPVLAWIKEMFNKIINSFKNFSITDAIGDFASGIGGIFGGDDKKDNEKRKEDIARIDAEIAEHQKEIKSGDMRTGWAQSREMLIEDLLKLKQDIANQMKSAQTGGTISKGGFIEAHDNELIALPGAAKIIPARQSAEMIKGRFGKTIPVKEQEQMPGSSGTIAPTTIVNKTSGSTSMMMGSSSTDKSNWKYGMQGA